MVRFVLAASLLLMFMMPGPATVQADSVDELTPSFHFDGMVQLEYFQYDFNTWQWERCYNGFTFALASLQFDTYDYGGSDYRFAQLVFDWVPGASVPELSCGDINHSFWHFDEDYGDPISCAQVASSSVSCAAHDRVEYALSASFDFGTGGNIIDASFMAYDDVAWPPQRINGYFLAGVDPDTPVGSLLDRVDDESDWAQSRVGSELDVIDQDEDGAPNEAESLLCGPAKPVVQTVGGPVGKCVPGGDFRPRDHDQDDDGLPDSAETALCAKGYPPRQAITFFDPALGACLTKKDYEAP